MSNNLTRGIFQVFEPTAEQINDALRQVRNELDEIQGLRGRARTYDRLGIDAPTSTSDAAQLADIRNPKFSDGTAAAPAQTYSDDTDLGSYRIGANNEGFSAGGVLRWDYDSTRLKLASGYSLDLTSLTAGSVIFSGASGRISQDNANFFWDDTNNRLGIGTTAPDQALDIRNELSIFGASASLARIRFRGFYTASPADPPTDQADIMIIDTGVSTLFRVRYNDAGTMKVGDMVLA